MSCTLNILTNLNDQDHYGGALLRIQALKEIYQRLGVDSNLIYLSEFERKQTIRGIWNSIKFHADLRPLFRKSKLSLPKNSWLQIENIEFFNWSLPKDLRGLLYDAHNLEHELYFDRADRKNSENFAKYESEMMDRAQLVLFCSERERKKMIQKIPKLVDKSIVIPNLVKKSSYKISSQKKVISFIGSLNYYPNEQAALYIINNIYPSLEVSVREKYQFIVAGKNPSSRLQTAFAEQDGVILQKDLTHDEIQNLYADTFISLVPLESGSGTRLKVAEAIFSGSYVLSTPLGSEGYTSPLITNCSLQEFPTALLSLLKLPPLDSQNTEIEQFSSQADVTAWYEQNKCTLESKFKGLGIIE